jgi:hypothetical protein
VNGDEPDYLAEELTARLNRLELRLDDIDQLETDYSSNPSQGAAKEMAYDNLDSWVEQFFAVTFTRSLGGEWRWCPRWREHPEAVFRLDALWRSYETLRREGGMGTAVWLRDHLDQYGALLSARGPFALCTVNRHEVMNPLPVSDSTD